MRTFFILASLVIVLLLIGLGIFRFCFDKPMARPLNLQDIVSMKSGYDKTIANAIDLDDHVKSFNSLFPKTNNFISYYTGEYGSSIWNSEVGLHDRYVLTMQFKIAINRDESKIKRTSEPDFHLVEVFDVSTFPNGTASIRYGSLQLEFGDKEWGKIVDSGGDFSVIGANLITDKPVSGFDRAMNK